MFMHTVRSWVVGKWRSVQRPVNRRRQWTLAMTAALEQRTLLTAFAEFVDPNPHEGNRFGDSVVPLSTGNVVVTSPFDDAGGSNAGAVYLFNGATGALISTLRGSHAGDIIGVGGALALANGNFVIQSLYWDNGSAADAGAVTWGSGTTGVSGVVSAANSLVGSQAYDSVGASRIVLLGNGNFVVTSLRWDNGSVVDAGAVTWVSGVSGLAGEVNETNSLVGSHEGDQIGAGGVISLGNGNYLAKSYHWNSTRGAATWGNGATGVIGVVSAANSLTGSTPGDSVGFSVQSLTNGNFVLASPEWDNPTDSIADDDSGAATWGNGATGTFGVVGSANSLIGSLGDRVSSNGIKVLDNGNYIVLSQDWNAIAGGYGAVTWGDGAVGTRGKVQASNSLVGSHAGDRVGSGLFTILNNGNLVMSSPYWDNGTEADTGAVTWMSATRPTFGVLGAANSLVGSTQEDHLGSGNITRLSNGNYLVSSPDWDNGAAIDAGAVTWGNGTSGVSGAISAANSLVGSTTGDRVGYNVIGTGVALLSNGNYVVSSPYWSNGAATHAGASTWGSGTSGVSGVVSAFNSLVGENQFDQVGWYSSVFSNGNYVVVSFNWSNGTAKNAGAVTWGSGTTGISGLVSSANSLVGSAGGDLIGSSSVTPLSNGNYVVNSPGWNRGIGAVTWGSGTTGISGFVSSANSLVGSAGGDLIGSSDVTPLSNGNYVVNSPRWNRAMGAVTWGNGTAGISGVVSVINSLVGSTANDDSSSKKIVTLSNGNYLVQNSRWDNGTAVDAGAVTWGSGTSGVSGVISAANSLIGNISYDFVGEGITLLSNGNYVVTSPFWNNGAVIDAGAVTWGSGASGISGIVRATNSLAGSKSGDFVGGSGVTALGNGNYIVTLQHWFQGATRYAGAVAWGSGTKGVRGVVSALNSLIGASRDSGLQDRVVLDSVHGTYYTRFLSDGGGRVRVGSQFDPVDFGDLPDSFGTTLLSDGARHLTGGSLFLGAGVSKDFNGIPGAAANSDELDDGVSLPTVLYTNQGGTVTVTASQAGKLDAFIDFNGNGVFNANERITPLGGLALIAGANTVSFTVPANAVAGSRAARFRVSTAGGLAATGLAADGEVEDHLVFVATSVTSGVQVVADPDHPGQTMLLINGTSGNDVIVVSKSDNGVVVRRNGVRGPVLYPTSRIVVSGREGNDRITVESRITLPTWIDGDAGQDTLTGGGGHDQLRGGEGDDTIHGNGSLDTLYGGAGNDKLYGALGENLMFGEAGNDTLFGRGVLVGGDGNDSLTADGSRSLLIGGAGVDVLRGARQGDLLIGGTTDFDKNPAALLAIRKEWASATPVSTRIDHLTGALPGGLNGSYRLISDVVRPGTVHNDAAIDTITNSVADDWLLLFSTDLRSRVIGRVNHL